MQDPYQTLGVAPDASEEDIKRAYRTLSRKYHPDANINNPLKDEAEAKFKEIQQAYQKIIDDRERGYSSGYGGSAYGSGYDGDGDAGSFGGFGPFGGFGSFGGRAGRAPGGESETDMHLRAAANYIQGGRYKEALHVLDGIKERGALWYFYSASANSGMGNNVTALGHAKEAVRLEPGNYQYQVLLNHLEGGGRVYQGRQGMYGYGFPVGDTRQCSNMCMTMMLCNFFGGGCFCPIFCV
jgi:molecular chaperone DnaJ